VVTVVAAVAVVPVVKLVTAVTVVSRVLTARRCMWKQDRKMHHFLLCFSHQVTIPFLQNNCVATSTVTMSARHITRFSRAHCQDYQHYH
jgi:hypothetical protein